MRAVNVVVVATIWITLICLFVLGFLKVACAQEDKTALALVQCIRMESRAISFTPIGGNNENQ